MAYKNINKTFIKLLRCVVSIALLLLMHLSGKVAQGTNMEPSVVLKEPSSSIKIIVDSKELKVPCYIDDIVYVGYSCPELEID